jgi:hypothetical protein
MKFKVPTFHETANQGVLDEAALLEIDKQKQKEALSKSLSRWTLFWFSFTVIAYLIVSRVNPTADTDEIVGYINFAFGGLLLYTSLYGGSQYLAGGGLVDQKISLKDYVDSRQRVFSKWTGPLLGMIIGIIMIIASSI